MLELGSWLIFFSAAAALAFAPGPGMLYVLSRTIVGGRWAGMASTIGTALGGSIHVVAAAVGVSALLAKSALAFTLIKYLGAVFLVYLGLKMIYSGYSCKGESTPFDVRDKRSSQNSWRSLVYQGTIAELLNPKTAIFFLAFIPQFVSPNHGAVFGQFLVLGSIVVLLNAVPDLLISLLAAPIERLWTSSFRFRKLQQYSSGVCLICLGIYLAFTGQNKDLDVGR